MCVQTDAESRAEPLIIARRYNYSALAITAALTLRQTEGLIASIVRLLGLDLLVPDHSTIGRRAKTVPRPAKPPAGRSTSWSTVRG